RRHPRARFLVVGEGPAEADLKATMARHGAAGQLILAGKRTGAALCAAYRAMDLFAFASRSETHGMVVAEAMAAGLPVVALSASGVREVVRDGENGYLLPARAKPADFAVRLARLAVRPALRRRLGRGASATAREFSREASAEKALKFYAEIRAR